jgi:hypothetical protein
LSAEEAKAKTIELFSSCRENGEPYMKKSLWSQERENGKGEENEAGNDLQHAGHGQG